MAQNCPICGAAIQAQTAVCPQCGFKLPDKTQSFAPITMQPTPHMASEDLLKEATLTVVRGQQTGTKYRLTTNQIITIGRSPKCNIFLNDMTVSRDHANIVFKQGSYIIYDHESYNGVWVNNANVKSTELHEGDIIQIGTFCLLFSTKS